MKRVNNLRKRIISAICVVLCLSIILLAASCGADEFDEAYTAPSISPQTLLPTASSTEATSAADNTAADTATITQTAAPSTTENGRGDSATQRISFQYTGKIAQAHTIFVDAKELDGYNGMRDVTAKQIVLDMRVGINLSEYLDLGDTDILNIGQYCKTLRINGIKSVRLPVRADNYLDENYNISADFLKKIKKTADAVINCGMYCIISLAQEEDMLLLDDMSFAQSRSAFVRIWEQLSDTFKKYNDYLLFEGLSDYNVDDDDITAAEYSNFNLLNDAFVSTVRSSGGNNEVRHIIVSTYGSSYESAALSRLNVPKDSADNKMIVDVHLSMPSGFVGVTQIDDKQWGADAEKNTLDLQLYLIYYKMYMQAGFPVIIGKFGAADKNNDDARALYASFFVSTAYDYGMTCFWNDDGNAYKLFDRSTSEPLFRSIISSMVYSIQ